MAAEIAGYGFAATLAGAGPFSKMKNGLGTFRLSAAVHRSFWPLLRLVDVTLGRVAR
jgi:hypothetical protein